MKSQRQQPREAKICILGYFNEISPGDTFAEIHTFKDLTSALVFKDGILESFQAYGNLDCFGDNPNQFIFQEVVSDGTYSIKIMEKTVDELLAGTDIKMLFCS